MVGEGSDDSKIGLASGIVYFENKCLDWAREHLHLEESAMMSTRKDAPSFGYRACFQKYRHSTLVGFVDEVLTNVSSKECLRKCFECSTCLRDGKSCKSATFFSNANECILATAARKSNPEFFDQSERLAEFFERRRECRPSSCEDREVRIFSTNNF